MKDKQLMPPIRPRLPEPYWKSPCGNHVLYHGDCLKILPLLGKVDAVVTDPPYGIGADRNLRANKRHGKAAVASKDYGLADWDGETPHQDDLNLIVQKGKWNVFWGGNYFHFQPSSCWLVWDKDNGDNGYADCELAWTNLPKAVRKFRWRWMGMLQELAGLDKEVREHPTQKPVELLKWCINLCPDYESIFDPYTGSGTTGVACIRLGRKFTGIEIEEKYCKIAAERMQKEWDRMERLRLAEEAHKERSENSLFQ